MKEFTKGFVVDKNERVSLRGSDDRHSKLILGTKRRK